MRYLIIFLFLYYSLFAEDKKQKLTIGLGPFFQTQPYKDIDTKLIASPVIFYDNGIAYIRWSRAGIYFYGDKSEDFSYGFSITIQPRVYGYKSDDIIGMNERKSTWEGGLAFSAKTEKAYIEIMALTDILHQHESWLIKTELGYDLELGNFSIYPSVILVYQSGSFLDYYYGVKDTEVRASGFSMYEAKAGWDIGLQTYIKYPFTKKLATLINIRADRLAKEATNSPIVNDKFMYSGLASLIYTFYY